jgi:sec-independent protein translocase protein TatC
MRLPRRLGHGQEVELVGHLEELRSRIFVAGGAILVTTIIAFTFHRRVIRLLVEQLPPNHRHLLTLGVAEPFTTSLKVSLALGVAFALPIVLWQLWSFLAPALTPSTQHGIAGFTVFAAALMVGGVIFGYEIALPAALHFLTNYDNSVYNVQIRAADFISFAVLVLAACGAVFELPIVVLGLVRVKALTSTKLRRNRRIGYMIVACVGVALPGVDPVTTVMETIPLAILFESSIWLSVAFEKRWFAPLAAVEGDAAG